MVNRESEQAVQQHILPREYTLAPPSGDPTEVKYRLMVDDGLVYSSNITYTRNQR